MFDLERRKPIWIALSEFYLDTELSDSALRHIAFTFLDSPYTLDEVRVINKYEVFPLLQANLLSPAGIWAGFDEDWLVEKITARLKHRTKFKDLGVGVKYQMFKWMQATYWERLVKIYNELKANPDSFIVACRAAYNSNILPFQFEKSEDPIYKKIEQIALRYRDTNRIRDFYQNLQEGQYLINIWTAYFLLEIFSFEKEATLVGLNDQETIFGFCYRLIENNFQDFKGENQIRNCSYWLEEKQTSLPG